MKTAILLRAISLSVSLVAFFPGTTHALELFAEVFVAEGEESRLAGLDSATSTTTTGVSASAVSPHEWGGSEILEFSGAGTASAAVQSLKTSANASITNSFHDPEYNFDEGTGVPTHYVVQSIASFSEILQYGGEFTSYTSKYTLRLTGTISGEGGFTRILLAHAMAPQQTWEFNTPGNFDVILTSDAFVHGFSPQEFSLEILTSVNLSTEFREDGAHISGAANFGNTLEIIGIDIRDDEGNLLPQGTVTGDSGTVYDIVAVPEPSALGLILTAAALALARRSRCRHV